VPQGQWFEVSGGFARVPCLTWGSCAFCIQIANLAVLSPASIHTDAEDAAVLSPPITEQRYALHSPAVTPLGKRNHHGILYRELISRRAIVF
jgi:hypothetical protein